MHSVLLASAKTITIVVGGNGTTQDASKIFQPQEVTAAVGDFVVFNCTSTHRTPSTFQLNSDRVFRSPLSVTNGTHTAVESTFAEPCLLAHEANSTINGFDSGLRNTVNGTAMTNLTVEIKEGDENRTIWFYDLWGCGAGGVGAINANDSDWQNFDAFVRNAKRLNGTGGSSSGGGSFTGRPSSSRPVPTGTTDGNSAGRVGGNVVMATVLFAPLLFATLVL